MKDADSPEAKKAATAALKAAKKELKENPAPSKAELELLEQAEERAKERGDSDDSSAVSVPSVGGGLGGAFVAAMAAAAAAAKLVAAVRAAAAAAALLRGHWLIAPQGTAAAATDAEPCSPCKPPPTCRPPKKWVCEPTGEADTPMTPQQPGDTVEPEKKKEEEEEEETGEGKEPPKGGGGGGAPHTPPAAGGKRAPITPEHSGTVEGRRSTEEPGEGSRKPTPPTVDDAIKTPTVEGRRVLRRECDRLAKQAKADLEAGTGRIGELQARQTALDAAIVDAYNKARLGGSHSRRAAALIKRARRSIPRGGIAQRNAAVRLRNEAYGSSSGAMKQYGYSECVKLLSDGALDALERAMAAAEAQFAAANMALAVAAAADGTAGTPLDILTLITLWFKGKTHVELSALFRDMERILENYGDWVDDGPARVKALFDEALDVKKGFDSWSRLTEILDVIGLVGLGARLAIGGAKLLFKAGTHLLRGSADDAARQLGRQADQVSETVESLGPRAKPDVVAPDAVSESVPSGGGGRFTPDTRTPDAGRGSSQGGQLELDPDTTYHRPNSGRGGPKPDVDSPRHPADVNSGPPPPRPRISPLDELPTRPLKKGELEWKGELAASKMSNTKRGDHFTNKFVEQLEKNGGDVVGTEIPMEVLVDGKWVEIRADVLERAADGSFVVHEVKSSLSKARGVLDDSGELVGYKFNPTFTKGQTAAFPQLAGGQAQVRVLNKGHGEEFLTGRRTSAIPVSDVRVVGFSPANVEDGVSAVGLSTRSTVSRKTGKPKQVLESPFYVSVSPPSH